MRRILLTAACAFLLFTLAGSASAAPVPPGGFALIELTGTLTNISVNAEAPAQMDMLFSDTYVRFPMVDATATTFAFAGGILLNRMSTMLSLSDFVINLAQNRILAEVNNTGGSVLPLFNMVPCLTVGTCPVGNTSSIITGFGLNLTTEGRTLLNNTFSGLNLPVNFQFGILKQVTLVPEPTTGLLVLAGLLALGARARRRAA